MSVMTLRSVENGGIGVTIGAYAPFCTFSVSTVTSTQSQTSTPSVVICRMRLFAAVRARGDESRWKA